MYRAFVTREPNSEFSPGLSMQAIEAYRKGGFTQLVLDGKREYVALYNYGTTFWQGRNRADYPNIAKELKTNLKDVATYFHAEAQKSKKADDYREAARWYRTYLESFPDDPESFGTNYLLAETLYESERLPAARPRNSRRTAYNYPRNPRSAAAAYAALGSLPEARREAAGRARRPSGTSRRSDAGVKFGTSFPEHPDSAGVLTRAAEDIFATQGPAALHRGREPRARAPAAGRSAEAPHRLHHHRPGELRPAAVRRGGEGLHRGARSAAAERQDARRSHRAHRLGRCIARPRPSRRRATAPAPSTTSCASRTVAGTSKIAAQAEYDAGAQLIKLKEWPRAIQVLERFRANNPKSEYTADVTRKLAVAYGETGQAGQAAVEFERIALNPAETKDIQREANLQAADLYAKAGNTPKAVGMLERFVVTYPTPVADSIEARQKLADIAGNAGQRRQAALLAARNRQCRSHRGRRPHRSHAVPRREVAARAGRAGAR